MDVCDYRWKWEGIKTMSHCVHSVFGPSPIAVKSTIIFMYIIDLHNILFVHVPEYCLLIIRFFFHRSPDSSRHFSQPCLTGPIYCIFFFSKYCAVCELLCNLLLFHLCLCTLRCTCIIPMCQVFFSCNILEKKLSTDRVRYFFCFLLIHVFGEI